MVRREYGPVVLMADWTAWCTRCGWEVPEGQTPRAVRLACLAHALDPSECERTRAAEREASMSRHPSRAGVRTSWSSPFGPLTDADL